ncbi:unnamed protein product [Allacma fusca]|uniref:AB hydrolase-1 domain-containing protein n=1 Tax=Allacma fusca TaxID=39272 RepID=A0A8J2LMP0_9HEXA|nr:unnamed protein product [Allacma fusca]
MSSLSRRILSFSTNPGLIVHENWIRATSDFPAHGKHFSTQEGKIEVDGISLHYKETGNGPHTVLCLPGIIGCIQFDFGPILDKMDKDKFKIVCWDPPGQGKSRPPDRDFSNYFYRRDGNLVMKLMNKLGHDKFSILGWSNGGVTGLCMAADYPTQIHKLVSWGAHSFPEERALTFARMMGNLDLWSEKMKAPVLEMYGEEYLLKMLKDWGDSVEELIRRTDHSDFMTGLSQIACPTLIIHGEDDPVLGVEHAEHLVQRVKNAKLHVMPNAKHNLHLKFTKEFLEVVEPFLLSSETEQ